MQKVKRADWLNDPILTDKTISNRVKLAYINLRKDINKPYRIYEFPNFNMYPTPRQNSRYFWFFDRFNNKPNEFYPKFHDIQNSVSYVRSSLNVIPEVNDYDIYDGYKNGEIPFAHLFMFPYEKNRNGH